MLQRSRIEGFHRLDHPERLRALVEAAGLEPEEADVLTDGIALPHEAAEVTIQVFNGSRTKGVADQVSDDFKNRGFRMQPPAKSKTKLAAVAVVRYGPKTVGAAQWIRAHFLGEAEPQFSAERTSDVIDVVIGDKFRQLATRTEVNQSLAQLSGPALPPGTCAA